MGDRLPAHLIPANREETRADDADARSRSRRAVSDAYAAAFSASPRRAESTEDALSRIWRNLSQVDEVGIHTTFLLGDIRCCHALSPSSCDGSGATALSTPGHPTIAALARLLEGSGDCSAQTVARAAQRPGTRPPLL